MKLAQRTILDNPGLYEVALPFTAALREIHANGSFPLVHDPLIRKQASIIGMFVLRPKYAGWFTQNGVASLKSLFEAESWAYNVVGLDGGGLISGYNAVDAFRLALQYGCSDAVLTGTKSLCFEGCDNVVHNSDGSSSVRKGYVFQPYVLCEWDQLRKADVNLHAKITEQRQLWQRLGYLSQRLYPAQIAVTSSGIHHQDSKDFLEARIFHDRHPTGEMFESYIITSQNGALEIKSRAHLYGLQDRIGEMLIILSPPHDPAEIDYEAIPYYLYASLGLRIVNHDGGRQVLKRFVQHNIVSQMNLSLMKGGSMRKMVEMLAPDDSIRESILQRFDCGVQTFFSTPSGAVPAHLEPIYAIEDMNDEITVVSFAVNGIPEF
jgi:hypothetical protein